MWPWGHAAVGYLLYTVLTRYRDDRPPGSYPVLWVLFGTQFPDLIDKPLVWYAGVLPTGRSLAHSLVVLVPLCLVLYVVLGRRDRAKEAVAFAIGAFSHVIVDVLPSLVGGEYAYAAFLVWPLLPLVESPEPGSFVEHLLGIEPTLYFLFQIGLVAIAGMVWWRDGRPGLELLREVSRELTTVRSP